jgi:hypothetical protein
VGVELFHADRQTDITKIIDAFRNFVKVPKNATKTTFIHEIETTNVKRETLAVGHSTRMSEWMHRSVDNQTLPTGSTRGQDQLKTTAYLMCG